MARLLLYGVSLFRGSLSRGSLSREVSVWEGFCPGGLYPEGLFLGVSVWEVFCSGGLYLEGLWPGLSLSWGVSVGGSLSGRVSVQGVSVQGGLCRADGVFVWEDFCPGFLVQGVSVWGVFV